MKKTAKLKPFTVYSSMSPKTGYIVTFPPDNWLNGSMLMDNRLYCCLSPGQLAIMTYLVSSRRSIEIWGGVVKSMEGKAEPIYFTNPPYFYRLSGTDQISVSSRSLNCLSSNQNKQKKTHRLHTYTAVFCARKYDVTACANDVIDGAVKIKDDTTL